MDELSSKAKKNTNKESPNYYPLLFTLIFLAVLFQYSFPAIEATLYDLRVKYDIGFSGGGHTVSVRLDEESEEFLGESYPYTFIGHQRFLDRLIKERPAAIIYFVNFLAPDSYREIQNMEAFHQTIKDFQSKGGIFRFGTGMDSWGEYLPPEGLRDLGFSLALLNMDNMAFAKDDVVRRAILNVSGEDSLHMWVANEFRVREGLERLTINDINGAYYLRDADATFSLFRYPFNTTEQNNNLAQISFHRAQVGNYPRGFFTDKIVLVGPSYISNPNDFVLTPFNQDQYTSSQLSVHSAIIEALIHNKTVVQVSERISFFIAVFLAFVLSWVISKLRPTRGLVFTAALIISLFIVGHILFSLFGIWLYLTHILLTVFVVYYIWVPFRAIGEYQRRFAIQEETKLLKKVENLKQNFISLMSHDLKTPVAKIAGIIDVMKQKYKDENMQKDMSMVDDATRELNGFISSILDLTKIESQDLAITKQSKDINVIVESVVKSLDYEAKKSGVDIQVDLAPLYPIQIDVNLLRRVVSNLVENAIKYSGEGATVVVKSYDDQQWVYLEVTDNGPGISSEDQELIFDRFYRVKNDASHKVKGSGLGLYLVKYFVELHGGSISITSEVGQGTTFTVKLQNQ